MAARLGTAFVLISTGMAAPVNQALFHVSQNTQKGFLWSSIGLAVLTALFQGLVTALASMTESANNWTFRFRLARIEHWWWSVVSMLLLASFMLIVLTFLAGNDNEALSILALSTATFLTIVQYMIPAWRSRHFLENRWLAWTGDSRTSIHALKAVFCGDKTQWARLARGLNLSHVQPTPSDWYGWRLLPLEGMPNDPTDILRGIDITRSKEHGFEAEDRAKSIYYTGETNSNSVSLLWGKNQGFSRRVSRAISSMPTNLLQSRPFTIDGYVGNGLCLAMGILGRNKGLQPKNLVFNMSRAVSSSMEDFGTWAPRPNKVLRSYYMSTLRGQYGGLGQAYVDAATELALLLMDVPPQAIAAWLNAGMEQQSLERNRQIAEAESENRTQELEANYQCSYVGMIMSLNYMDKKVGSRFAHGRPTHRPDILCTGLLLKAWGAHEPRWWNQPVFVEARKREIAALEGDMWKDPASLLLGLACWPPGFEKSPSIWEREPASEKMS